MAIRSRQIPEPRLEPDRQPLRFSFKHLDLSNPKFRVEECCAEYMQKLLGQLQTFSTWTVEQFSDQNNREYRHIIDFDQTSEVAGFTGVPHIDPEQLGYHEGWQFAVDPESRENSHWRAHGILIDDTFYLVWLDQDHRLYSRR